LAINTTINVLHIYISDHNISREVWQGLSTCLKNPNSAMDTLILEKIGNDDVINLGEALTNNKTLTTLDIRISALNQTIALDGWQGFSNLLRNPNSL
jgi:hypothetical protein